MQNNLVPQYLSILVSKPRQTHYLLRDNNRIPTIFEKTNIYMNSFLPRTISNWNALAQHTKLATSPESFKHKMRKNAKPPSNYNSGIRNGQVLQAKLIMACSDLYYHLVQRHIQDNSKCDQCGAISETPAHYLLQCPNYLTHRIEMKNKLESLDLEIDIDSDILIYGSRKIDHIKNKQIMEIVIHFILASERFKGKK